MDYKPQNSSWLSELLTSPLEGAGEAFQVVVVFNYSSGKPLQEHHSLQLFLKYESSGQEDPALLGCSKRPKHSEDKPFFK